jgi:hypothetical protein
MSEVNFKMYAALKRITKYQTVPQLQRTAGKDYGLEFNEALEYAYENVIQEAKNGIKGVRLPRKKPTADAKEIPHED